MLMLPYITTALVGFISSTLALPATHTTHVPATTSTSTSHCDGPSAPGNTVLASLISEMTANHNLASLLPEMTAGHSSPTGTLMKGRAVFVTASGEASGDSAGSGGDGAVPAYTPVVTPAPDQDAALASLGYYQTTYYTCVTLAGKESCGWHVPVVKVSAAEGYSRPSPVVWAFVGIVVGLVLL